MTLQHTPTDFVKATRSLRVRSHGKSSTLNRLCDFVARFKGEDVATTRDYCHHQGCRAITAVAAAKSAHKAGLIELPIEGSRGWSLVLTKEGRRRAARVADACREERHSMVSSLKD